MRKIKTVEVPATTHKDWDDFCELCEKELPDRIRHYDLNEVTIKCEQGTSYPERTDTKAIVFDACSKCFKAKIVPALKALGMKPRIEKSEY